MVEQSLARVIMNPVRQRIVQYLILNKSGTVSGIAQELSDVPRPSLYRHIGVLLKAGCVEVTGRRAVRGAVEKTYTLAESPMGEPGNEQIAMLIQNMLMEIAASFSEYFRDEHADPKKDMLSVSTSTLLLDDGECMELLRRIGEVYGDYIHNKPREGRRQRSLTVISAPEKKKGEKNSDA